jgi:hypothetical protein
MLIPHSSITTFTVFLSILTILGGCQSIPETKFHYAEGTNFTRFATFSWIPERPLRFHTMDAHSSPLLEQHLKDAASKAFTDAGLRFVDDPGQADVLMAFTVGSRERLLSDEYYSGSIYGYPSYGGYWIDSGRRLGSIMKGQVCVDLFDGQTGRPLWHGTAEENLRNSDLNYWRERLPVIMGYIASGYPPEASR